MRQNVEITALLSAWGDGDRSALDAIIPLLYAELRQLAERYFRDERPNRTLQATALVHEAYLRLSAQTHRRWKSRSHFFSVAAGLMRQILVDGARRRQAAKRAGGAARVTLTNPQVEAELGRSSQTLDILILNDCLERLSEIDPLKTRMVEMRFFAGLDTGEIAEALNLPDYTVRRGLDFALAWLSKELRRGSGSA